MEWDLQTIADPLWVAAQELERLNKSVRYEIDTTCVHSPNPVGERIVCSVGLDGALIAGFVYYKNLYSPDWICPGWQQVLHSLDLFTKAELYTHFHEYLKSACFMTDLTDAQIREIKEDAEETKYPLEKFNGILSTREVNRLVQKCREWADWLDQKWSIPIVCDWDLYGNQIVKDQYVKKGVNNADDQTDD
jgi:hypothetical protein